MGAAENASSTAKELKVEDKDHGWLLKMGGDYIKGVGKCAHKVDGVKVFKFEALLEHRPNTDSLCA